MPVLTLTAETPTALTIASELTALANPSAEASVAVTLAAEVVTVLPENAQSNYGAGDYGAGVYGGTGSQMEAETSTVLLLTAET